MSSRLATAPRPRSPSGPAARRGLATRLRRFASSRELRRRPLPAIGRRLWWRIHWRIRPHVPMVVPFHGGRRLQLAHSSASLGVYLNDGFSDSSVASLFIEFLRPGMQVLDCGAHIGEYTVLFGHLVGPSGAVHAFEPDPRMFRVLQANVARNGLANVTANNVALSDREGSEWFTVSEDATMSSLGRFAGDGGSDGLLVQTTTIDRYRERVGLGVVDALKMDIEGAEAAALMGGRRLLQACRPRLVFVECDGPGTAPFVERFLKELGYEIEIRHDAQHLHPHVVARAAR